MRPPGRNKVVQSFNEANAGDITVRPSRNAAHKQSSPLAFRVTDDERAELKRDAGSMTLSAYIRLVMFGSQAEAYKSRRQTRKNREPRTDEVLLAQILAVLGQSRLAANFNQIVKLANCGALPVTPELESELKETCEAIRDVRVLLIKALGIKAQ